MFANSLMLPIFDYLDIIYSKAGKSKLSELDVLYKKIAKIALDVSTTESRLTVYSAMKWLPLHLRRQVHLSTYMFRIIKNISPSNCMNKFKYVSGGSRNSNRCNLYVPKSKSLKKFTFLGAKCWNTLPQDLRELEDVKTFSSAYKCRLLDSITDNSNYRENNCFSYFYELPTIST